MILDKLISKDICPVCWFESRYTYSYNKGFGCQSDCRHRITTKGISGTRAALIGTPSDPLKIYNRVYNFKEMKDGSYDLLIIPNSTAELIFNTDLSPLLTEDFPGRKLVESFYNSGWRRSENQCAGIYAIANDISFVGVFERRGYGLVKHITSTLGSGSSLFPSITIEGFMGAKYTNLLSTYEDRFIQTYEPMHTKINKWKKTTQPKAYNVKKILHSV